MNTTDSRLFTYLDSSQVGTWPVRIIWFAFPLTYQTGFSQATAGLDETGTFGLEVIAWLVWFVGLIAVAVHHPTALSVIRILAPVPAAALLLAAVLTGGISLSYLLILGYCLVALVAIFLPAFGDPMVNGSAYGPEKRVALRPPGYATLAAVPLVWSLMFGLLATGFAMAASGNALIGSLFVLVGAAMSFAGFRALHQLSRRWMVFVPAGFVLHDHVILAEPILIPRKVIDNLGLVGYDHGDESWKQRPGNLEAVDATGGAAGLVLEVNTSADIPITVKGRGSLREATTRSIRFTPTLPGKVLTEARIRGIRVGEAKLGRSLSYPVKNRFCCIALLRRHNQNLFDAAAVSRPQCRVKLLGVTVDLLR